VVMVYGVACEKLQIELWNSCCVDRYKQEHPGLLLDLSTEPSRGLVVRCPIWTVVYDLSCMRL
jgi:hypothetical protein